MDIIITMIYAVLGFALGITVTFILGFGVVAIVIWLVSKYENLINRNK